MKRWKALAGFVCALISGYAMGSIVRQALEGARTQIAVLAVIGSAALVCLLVWLEISD